MRSPIFASSSVYLFHSPAWAGLVDTSAAAIKARTMFRDMAGLLLVLADMKAFI